MTNVYQNRSEVARILAQIDAEYEAARQGLTGLSQGTPQHAFINARMELVGQVYTQLRMLVGDVAMKVIAERLDYLCSQPDNS